MGPNVKFVSAITDAFSNKKNGGQFFSAKKTKPGGHSEAKKAFCAKSKISSIASYGCHNSIWNGHKIVILTR